MDWDNGDQRHQKRGRQTRLYDKAGPISPRRKDEHQYTRMGKGEIASPNSTSHLLPLRVRLGKAPAEHNESASLQSADMRSKYAKVRVGPMSDIRSLLDHLVGGRKQRGGHSETKRLRRLEIDDQIKLGRLGDWNVARLCALKNFVGNISDAADELRNVDPIGHQPS